MPSVHDLSIYHKTDALLETFTRLSDPSRCGSRLTVDNLRDTEDPAFSLRVATFTDSQTRSTQAPIGAAHVLLNFGAHGRELISSEVALRLAQMLCGEAPSRFAGDPERSRDRIAEMLRHVVVKIVPVQSPYSRRLAEVGSGSCKERRLNARGVDVNRNWDVLWAAGAAGEGSSQYRGPRPFSEPETRALARFAEEWRPDVFVDVRSGDRYLAMPHAGRASGPSDRADRNGMLDVMRSVSAMIGKQYPKLMGMGDLPFGPASSLGEEPYKATGTALDYMYTRVGVRRSYMFEVFGASTVYGVGGRAAREIGRLPSAVVSLLQVSEGEADGSRISSSGGGGSSNGSNSSDGGNSSSGGGKSGGGGNSSPRDSREARGGNQTGAEGTEAAERFTRHVRRQVVRRLLGAISPARLALETAHRAPASVSPDPSWSSTPLMRSTSSAPSAGHAPSRRSSLVLLSVAEEATHTMAPMRVSTGMSAGLAAEEDPFDCVAFFNPMNRDEYEVTVNGWADALLVVINASVLASVTSNASVASVASAAAAADPTDPGGDEVVALQPFRLEVQPREWL